MRRVQEFSYRRAFLTAARHDDVRAEFRQAQATRRIRRDGEERDGKQRFVVCRQSMCLRHVRHAERLQLAPADRLLDDGARMIGVHMNE